MTRGAAVGVEALGPPPPAGANDSSSDVLRTVEWSDERGETRTAAVRRIPGWSWGVQLGVPWADGTAELVHATIEEHGLVVLAPPADFPKRPAAAGHAPEDAFDALRQLLEDLVSRERAAFQAEGVEWDSTDAETPVRSILARCHETLAQHHFELCCAVLRRCAMTVRGALHTRVDAEAAAALARVVAAIVETRAHRLQFGNTRYCIAKHFGYVLPTRALVRWLCDQFAGCERVVSVGAGSCFLEAAMQLEMRARGRATVLVCVENNVELIGHPAREAAAERSVEMVALGPDAAEGAGEHDNASTATGLRGFCCSPMKVVPSLPAAQPLRPADGLLVSWGRAVAEGERPEDNPWSVCEHAAARGEGAGVAVVIGGTDARWFRCDTFCGATLQGAAPPDGANAPTCARFADGREATWDGRPSSADGVPLVGYHGIGDHAVRRRARLLTKPPGPPSRARRRL